MNGYARDCLPVPGESYERLNIRTASGILPSISQEVVKFPLLGAVKKSVKFI